MSDESSNGQGEPISIFETAETSETKETSETPEQVDMIVQSAAAGQVQAGSAPQATAVPVETEGVETKTEGVETKTEDAAAKTQDAEKVTTPSNSLAPDLTKIGAGTFHPEIFGGVPVDAAKRFLLARAGVKAASPLHSGLADVGLAWVPAKDENGQAEPDLPRLPDVFPPEGYDAPLITVADWLAAMDVYAKSDPTRHES